MIVTKDEIVKLVVFIKACKMSGYLPDDMVEIIENLIREHVKAREIENGEKNG